MSTRPNRGKVEDEALTHLADASERVKDMHPEDGLKYRLDAIEETLAALAVYLDIAFAEIRGHRDEALTGQPPSSPG